MKRSLLQVDGLPMPLRALSAYSALCAFALGLVGFANLAAGEGTQTSWGRADELWIMPLVAVLLFLAARLMTWRDRRAWYALVTGAFSSLVTAAVMGNSATAGATAMLVVLGLPSSRAFFGVTPEVEPS